MGKGDKRTRRGKIYRGSHGNSRPHAARARTEGSVPTTATAKSTVPAAAKRAVRRTAPRKKAT